MNDEKKQGALIVDTPEEKALDNEVSLVERQANDMIIGNDTDYAYAGELTKKVKVAQKKVEEYWEPMRQSTYTAYKTVTDHKKQMVEPLKNAEKTLKEKMSAYVIEAERKRKEQEAEIRRQAQEEMERKLSEAAEAEENGNVQAAEYAMAEAEVMESVSSSTTVQAANTKVDGISKTKAWKITSIDADKVPIDIAGIVLRPVDEKAVMNLIKSSKGKVAIPGVTYEETVNISVRA